MCQSFEALLLAQMLLDTTMKYLEMFYYLSSAEIEKVNCAVL